LEPRGGGVFWVQVLLTGKKKKKKGKKTHRRRTPRNGGEGGGREPRQRKAKTVSRVLKKQKVKKRKVQPNVPVCGLRFTKTGHQEKAKKLWVGKASNRKKTLERKKRDQENRGQEADDGSGKKRQGFQEEVRYPLDPLWKNGPRLFLG